MIKLIKKSKFLKGGSVVKYLKGGPQVYDSGNKTAVATTPKGTVVITQKPFASVGSRANLSAAGITGNGTAIINGRNYTQADIDKIYDSAGAGTGTAKWDNIAKAFGYTGGRSDILELQKKFNSERLDENSKVLEDGKLGRQTFDMLFGNMAFSRSVNQKLPVMLYNGNSQVNTPNYKDPAQVKLFFKNYWANIGSSKDAELRDYDSSYISREYLENAYNKWFENAVANSDAVKKYKLANYLNSDSYKAARKRNFEKWFSGLQSRFEARG